MRLSHDRSAEIAFGIDTAHVGLPCRYELCRQRFVPRSSNSAEDLAVAVWQRDAHEVSAHGYHHQVEQPSPLWDFSKGFSRRGRSMLKRST